MLVRSKYPTRDFFPLRKYLLHSDGSQDVDSARKEPNLLPAHRLDSGHNIFLHKQQPAMTPGSFYLQPKRPEIRPFSRRHAVWAALPLTSAIAVVLIGAAAFPSLAKAFPPAPYFTIFGDARDQYGLLIPAGSASVVLSKGGTETMRELLTNAPGADYNYQIRVRMDQLRDTSASYTSKALTPGTVFTLGIESGGQIFYPIEMAAPPVVGAAADRRRLNLTLGVDRDGDGLPDAWEEAQLFQGGNLPGANGWDLSLIDREGDFDRDGKSNFAEYLAGTYAADAKSTLELQIKEKLPETVKLEFYAIYGKSYTLQSSPDLTNWKDASFTLSAPDAQPPGTPQTSLLFTRTGITSVYSAATPGATYYRLQIR